VSLQNPMLDAALGPLGPILFRDVALQLCREGLGIPVDVFEQAGVPDPVEIVGPPAENYVARVPDLVAIVLAIQRLVHVVDEVNDEIQRLWSGGHA
jgi:hypothetical protein